jgi:hypothetical protein
VLGNERRLRQLLGLPPTDQRLIRPVTDPVRVAVTFDWQSSVNDSLTRRAELRKQMLTLKKREAELGATRNLRLPTLNAAGGVYYRTYNQDLTPIIDPTGTTLGNNFSSTNYNAGLTFAVPLGNRYAHTAIRNAELQLARERAILREQQLQVVHELTSTIVELDRAYIVMNTNFNRRAAAQQQLSALNRKYEAGATSLDLVLDAQRRWADAEATYHRAVIDYNRAIADVHMSRGTLLDYDGVRLADAPGLRMGNKDAIELSRLRQEVAIDYTFASAKRPRTANAPPPNTAVAGTQSSPSVAPSPGLLPPTTSPAASLNDVMAVELARRPTTGPTSPVGINPPSNGTNAPPSGAGSASGLAPSQPGLTPLPPVSTFGVPGTLLR